MSRIAITGAGGFVGRYLSTTLMRRGVTVVGVTRSGSNNLPREVERAPIADLSDGAALARAFEGADAVVHLAARVHVLQETAGDPLAAFRRVNVDGTRTVMEAAAGAGVKQVVYASSIKALGERSTRPWVETDRPAPTDPYGLSKLEAEGVVLDMAASEGVAASILRLPLVYGPGVGTNMLRLFQAVERGLPLPLGGIENRRSLLFVGNLASAVEAILRTEAGREIFHVTDLDDRSTPELVEGVARALGRSARLVRVPLAVMAVLGRAGDLFAPVLPVPFTTAALGRLTGSLVMDASKLVRHTGYSPPYSIADGLVETARWYRSTQQRRDS